MHPASRPRVFLTASVVVFGALLSVVAGAMLLPLAGADFLPLWTGAHLAITAPERLYDFRYVTELQGSPQLRPFIYPPSALIVLWPFALLPTGVAFVVWTTTTGLLFLLTARRAGAPLWMMAQPVIWM